MSSMLRPLPPLAVLAAIVLFPAVSLGSAKNTKPNSTTAAGSSTVIGNSTTLVLYPSMTTMLQKGRITVKPVAPSSADKSIHVFPISGGHLTPATFAGSLSHSGGLTFSHASKRITLTKFVINTQTKRLTAAVGGKSLLSFNLNLGALKHKSEPHRTVVGTNIKLTVTPNAARALNNALSVTTFKAGQYFGVASIVVALK